MKVEYRLFLLLAVFFFGIAVVYAIFAGADEPVGVVGFGLTGGLSLIVGSFLWFSARRLQQIRPEDNVEAEVSDGAGELGFFSPGSYWPICIAGSAAVFAVGTAFLQVWLMLLTAIFLVMSIAGLLFEYHRVPQDH
ncbi:MAG: cytochrome c oxidase subunit 4 [Nakamurella sp.]